MAGQHLEVGVALLVGEAVAVQLLGSSPNFRQPLSPFRTMTNFRGSPLNVALGFRPVMIEALRGRAGLDLVLVAVEVDRALGLPRDRLGLLELLLAADGLDRLVEDRVRILVVGVRRGRRRSGDEEDGQDRTDEPLHGIASMMRGTPGAGGRDHHADGPTRAGLRSAAARRDQAHIVRGEAGRRQGSAAIGCLASAGRSGSARSVSPASGRRGTSRRGGSADRRKPAG